MISSLGKGRSFHDGCGLCSPGRWEPQRRICRSFTFTMLLRARMLKLLSSHFNIKDLVIRRTLGRFEEPPFVDALTNELRSIWKEETEKQGKTRGKRAGSEPMGHECFCWHMMGAHLETIGDPDW
eukprot:11643052-Karenia_brevis.AAC.1